MKHDISDPVTIASVVVRDHLDTQQTTEEDDTRVDGVPGVGHGDLPRPPSENAASESDYMRFRGKCLEMSEAAVAADPSLVLVRGHYICPHWGEQAHWWTVRADGTVHDPTALQFPSKGSGFYVPFDGFVECEECGKRIAEAEAYINPPHVFCSGTCYGRCVGVF